MLEAFFAFIINKKKTNRSNTKRLEKLELFIFKNKMIIECASIRGSNKDGRDVFLADSWRRIKARIELGRSFHQEGTFNLKVCNLGNLSLLKVMNLGKVVQRQWWFCKLTLIPWIFLRAAIGSQCKLINRGVTCVLFSSLKINCAAAFWINCKGLIEMAGRPAKRGLQ